MITEEWNNNKKIKGELGTRKTIEWINETKNWF